MSFIFCVLLPWVLLVGELQASMKPSSLGFGNLDASKQVSGDQLHQLPHWFHPLRQAQPQPRSSLAPSSQPKVQPQSRSYLPQPLLQAHGSQPQVHPLSQPLVQARSYQSQPQVHSYWAEAYPQLQIRSQGHPEIQGPPQVRPHTQPRSFQNRPQIQPQPRRIEGHPKTQMQSQSQPQPRTFQGHPQFQLEGHPQNQLQPQSFHGYSYQPQPRIYRGYPQAQLKSQMQPSSFQGHAHPRAQIQTQLRPRSFQGHPKAQTQLQSLSSQPEGYQADSLPQPRSSPAQPQDQLHASSSQSRGHLKPRSHHAQAKTQPHSYPAYPHAHSYYQTQIPIQARSYQMHPRMMRYQHRPHLQPWVRATGTNHQILQGA
ncbi:probable serine/threonine-protein kinase samkC isoform X19 [Simochromis diagramma]|uniref:probable serine/threonine-protein kinase samkC isoform X19 n=1 Tax=Simochromis diagramma TaxID=43689 RepID=UPI001A7EE84D|nr:probable serine/threonine-protein kinase samkC isoform X19 [Simochromis diagramma]